MLYPVFRYDCTLESTLLVTDKHIHYLYQKDL